MGTRIVFEDGDDTFYVTDEGTLEVHNPREDSRTLIDIGNLDGFIGWLTDEADKFKADETEGKANG